jgi:prefoldin subunit 5
MNIDEKIKELQGDIDLLEDDINTMKQYIAEKKRAIKKLEKIKEQLSEII